MVFFAKQGALSLLCIGKMLLVKVEWENVIVEKLWVAGGKGGGGEFNYLKNEMSFYHDIKNIFFPHF